MGIGFVGERGLKGEPGLPGLPAQCDKESTGNCTTIIGRRGSKGDRGYQVRRLGQGVFGFLAYQDAEV